MNLLFFLTPKQDVLYIYEDFTLRQTLEKWSNQRYATIPVLKRNGEYVGSITEGDILWAHEKSAWAGPGGQRGRADLQLSPPPRLQGRDGDDRHADAC